MPPRRMIPGAGSYPTPATTVTECVTGVYSRNEQTDEMLVRCDTHGESSRVFDAGDFRCGKGANWVFLVRTSHNQRPIVADLTQLRLTLLAQKGFTGDETYEVYARRWVDDDTLEPLAVTLVPGTNKWEQDRTHEFSYMRPQYRVTGPDGTEYLNFTVHITDY